MVIVIATHAVLGQSQNDEALMKINNSKIDRIIVSNSIPMEESGKVGLLILSFTESFLISRSWTCPYFCPKQCEEFTTEKV